jgi:hypothetical protein
MNAFRERMDCFMCRVKASIEDGLMPSEKIARIATVEGSSEEFTVSAKQVKGDTVEAACIGKQNGSVLLEMPRESASGKWRVWVPEDSVAAY